MLEAKPLQFPYIFLTKRFFFPPDLKIFERSNNSKRRKPACLPSGMPLLLENDSSNMEASMHLSQAFYTECV